MTTEMLKLLLPNPSESSAAGWQTNFSVFMWALGATFVGGTLVGAHIHCRSACNCSAPCPAHDSISPCFFPLPHKRTAAHCWPGGLDQEPQAHVHPDGTVTHSFIPTAYCMTLSLQNYKGTRAKQMCMYRGMVGGGEGFVQRRDESRSKGREQAASGALARHVGAAAPVGTV